MMTFLLPHGDSKNFPGWPQRSVQVAMSFSFLSIPFPFFTASIKTSSFTLRHNLINPAPRIPISSDLPTVTCLVTQCAIPLWSCSSYRMRIRPGLCDVKANELGGKIIQTHNYWFCLNNWLNCFFFPLQFPESTFFPPLNQINTLENCFRTARIWLNIEYVTNYFVYFSCLA